MVCVQMRTKTMRGRRNPGNQTTKNPLSGMSLDHFGDLVVNTNLGYKRSKLFNIKEL